MKLQDYIRGNRRGKDANRLEREALTDPFLSDAMDGYIGLQEDAASRVDRLQRRITVRTTRKRKGFQTWSAAAILLVLVTVGVHLLVNPLESMETVDIYYSLSGDELFMEDIFRGEATHVVAEQAAAPVPLQPVPVVEVEPVPLFSFPVLIGGEEYVAPYLPILNGDFTLKALDIPQVKEGIGKKPEPAVPASLYKQYLADHIQIPIEGVCPRTKGKVTVSFKVNPTGRPYDIQVVKGLCESLDNEAVRLVREGPNWKFGDQEIKMTIQL